MKQSGIYKIESKLCPDKIYIGSASSFSDRKSRHLKDLKQNRHPNKKLQNHFNKYGQTDILFTFIEPCFQGFLIIREQYYIDKLKPWFNICQIAGNSYGRIVSEETKKKMQGRIPWNKGVRGTVLSKEIRLKMSESQKGKTGFWKGKKLSEITKKKMSEAQKRIGNKPPIWINKNHSKETREKLSKIKTEYYAKR